MRGAILRFDDDDDVDWLGAFPPTTRNSKESSHWSNAPPQAVPDGLTMEQQQQQQQRQKQILATS